MISERRKGNETKESKSSIEENIEVGEKENVAFGKITVFVSLLLLFKLECFPFVENKFLKHVKNFGIGSCTKDQREKFSKILLR